MHSGAQAPPQGPREEKELSQELLKARIDIQALSFETTDDLQPLKGTIGQKRGVRAVQFALSHGSPGFNCYVSGPVGTGKMTTVMALARRRAMEEKAPLDWIYVNNFEKRAQPLPISLENGTARRFSDAMDDFIKKAQEELPKIFTKDEYREHRSRVASSYEEEKKNLINKLNQEASQRGFQIKRTPTGLVPVALKDGEPLSQEDYQKLSDEEKEKIQKAGQELSEMMEELLGQASEVEASESEALTEYDRKVAYYILGRLLDPLIERHKDEPRLNKFFNWVKRDIVKHIELFKEKDDPKTQAQLKALMHRYQVNVFVDNSEFSGAPVVYEDNPTYYNLLGAVEYRNVRGNMVTDFSKIKPGAVHRANGGYLILPVRELLLEPFAWDALKRTLRSKQARIENLSEKVRGAIIETLRPEPMPVDFKVILIGSPTIYGLLHQFDEDFRRLFKVRADFDVDMPRDAENELSYARFIASRCRYDGLRPFDKASVGKIIEYGSRLAEDQKRLSTRFLEISDLASEASYWAMDANSPMVREEHVQKALEEKVYRSRMIEEKLQELMVRGVLLIDVEGEKFGQLNGLTVLALGDYAFGKPVKITARTWLGKKGLLQIERETRMSGPIHNKGVLIITGYLGGKFAREHPLPLSASLTFEQLYSEVEGDSASSAELYALLSSLSEIPLSQSIAVTGSVNQYGMIQPIGGVNEKIEGFFNLCKAKGLSGEQGVLIPSLNLSNLMLSDEVVGAVKEGRFHIYAVEKIEEGIEVMTGRPSQEVFDKVGKTLDEMHEEIKRRKEENED